MFDFYEIIITIPAVLIAISFHECAHAYVAKKMGDDTSYNLGRITINPVAHLDGIGTLMFIFTGFGWAKPVEINENNFFNKKLGIFFVSVAGVITNIIISILFMGVWVLLKNYNILSQDVIYEGIILDIFYNIAYINIGFAIFNLLPIPPLDGYRIISSFFSNNFRYKIYEYEGYGTILLVLLLVTNSIDFFLYPISSVVFTVVHYSINFLLGLFL